jgi:hypothetical protein
MKTIARSFERTSPISFCNRSVGVSNIAKIMGRKTDALSQKFARTISFGDKLTRLLEALIKLNREYNRPNWDAYGAKPIESKSYFTALDFALSIPSNIPTPEVDITPNGKVLFTWSEGNRKVFSVIVGNMKELSYAGIFGASETYGVEYFTDCIPETIKKNIENIYS